MNFLNRPLAVMDYSGREFMNGVNATACVGFKTEISMLNTVILVADRKSGTQFKLLLPWGFMIYAIKCYNMVYGHNPKFSEYERKKLKLNLNKEGLMEAVIHARKRIKYARERRIKTTTAKKPLD